MFATYVPNKKKGKLSSGNPTMKKAEHRDTHWTLEHSTDCRPNEEEDQGNQGRCKLSKKVRNGVVSSICFLMPECLSRRYYIEDSISLDDDIQETRTNT